MGATLHREPGFEKHEGTNLGRGEKRELLEWCPQESELHRICPVLRLQPRQVAVDRSDIHVHSARCQAPLPHADDPRFELWFGRSLQAHRTQPLLIRSDGARRPIAEVASCPQKLVMQGQ